MSWANKEQLWKRKRTSPSPCGSAITFWIFCPFELGAWGICPWRWRGSSYPEALIGWTILSLPPHPLRAIRLSDTCDPNEFSKQRAIGEEKENQPLSLWQCYYILDILPVWAGPLGNLPLKVTRALPPWSPDWLDDPEPSSTPPQGQYACRLATAQGLH